MDIICDNDTVLNFKLVNGIIIIDAEADGVCGQFAFDTGAMQTVIDPKYFPDVSGENVDVAKFSDGIKETGAKLGKLESAVFGGLSVSNLSTLIMDMSYVETPLKGLMPELRLLGTLGIDVLGSFVILLDYAAGKITLNPSERLDKFVRIPLDFDILPTIDISGHRFVLDTGANTCLLGADVIDSFDLQDSDQAGLYVIPKIDLCGNTYENILAVAADMTAIRQKVPADGVIGYQILSGQRSYLDFKTGELLLEKL